MEEACWNCGEPGHHRRACVKDAKPDAKRIVQKCHNKGPGNACFKKQQAKSWNRLVEKSVERNLALTTPLYLLKMEIERCHQFYFEALQEMNFLTPDGKELVFEVDVDLVREVGERISSLLISVKLEAPAARALLQHKYHALACDPIAAYKIDDIHGWNQKVQNRLYDFGRRASTAVNVLAVLSVLEEDFGSFMERGIRAFTGRPVPSLLMSFENERGQMKTRLRSTRKLISQHLYLFIEPESKTLRYRVRDLRNGWKELRQLRDTRLTRLTR